LLNNEAHLYLLAVHAATQVKVKVTWNITGNRICGCGNCVIRQLLTEVVLVDIILPPQVRGGLIIKPGD